LDAAGQPEGNRISLDRAPPQPPRQGKSIMAMATDGRGQAESANTSNPAVRTMMKLGAARKALLELSADLPTAAAGIQQVIAGLEQVVAQQVADIVSGNPPGSGGSGLGAGQANAAPTAPPVQTGM